MRVCLWPAHLDIEIDSQRVHGRRILLEVDIKDKVERVVLVTYKAQFQIPPSSKAQLCIFAADLVLGFCRPSGLTPPDWKCSRLYRQYYR